MHLSIIHDSHGNVISIAASPKGAPTAYLEARAGQFLAEIDATDLTEKMTSAAVQARLDDIMKNHRIESGAKARLVRR